MHRTVQSDPGPRSRGRPPIRSAHVYRVSSSACSPPCSWCPCFTMTHGRTILVRMEYQSDQALEELRAFVAVVDAQGFRSAARVTRGRKATLSKRVQDLEARL